MNTVISAFQVEYRLLYIAEWLFSMVVGNFWISLNACEILVVAMSIYCTVYLLCCRYANVCERAFQQLDCPNHLCDLPFYDGYI